MDINNVSSNVLIEELSLSQDGISNFVRQGIDPASSVKGANTNAEQGTEFGRNMFAGGQDQLYNDKSNANLVLINLEIRGDPFWLGLSDMEKIQVLDTITSDASRSASTLKNQVLTNNNFMNNLIGDPLFLLSFKTPQNYDSQTGIIDTSQSSIFVALYTVVQVESTFSDGKFTQTLTSIREMNTSYEVLAKYVQ